MNRLLLTGGELLDSKAGYKYDKKDILIEDGFIKRIDDDLKDEAVSQEVDLTGYIISSGFIDIHTHVYYGKTVLGIDPDIIGLNNGVTTVFDAGSAGPENFDDFYEKVISKSDTSVYSLLNIARTGLEKPRYELADLDNIDLNEVKEVYFKNKEYIKGIKARASASTVGELGIKPIEMAKKVASELNIPLVVHIGNEPPKIDDVLSLLGKGDVITHTFHGKPNGILDKSGNIKESFLKARDRGVLFDVGHGTSSFNFNTAKCTIENGMKPDIISTDIYVDNYKGPVYSLETTVNKMLISGMNVEECINCVTYAPSHNFKLLNMGMLKEGYIGDLTVFKMAEEEREYTDSEGNVGRTELIIKTKYIVKNGEIREVFK